MFSFNFNNGRLNVGIVPDAPINPPEPIESPGFDSWEAFANERFREACDIDADFVNDNVIELVNDLLDAELSFADAAELYGDADTATGVKGSAEMLEATIKRHQKTPKHESICRKFLAKWEQRRKEEMDRAE